jgi:peptide/nickel transport system substrate-binding protein
MVDRGPGTSAWFPALARRDYLIGANLTAAAIDDPDVYLYENYRCGTSRNYTDYCSEEMDRLMDQQSQEMDRGKRLQLVWQIQRKLEADVAHPMLGWRHEYFTQWPHVKNLVPHHSLYNYSRMQDVWLDNDGPAGDKPPPYDDRTTRVVGRGLVPRLGH